MQMRASSFAGIFFLPHFMPLLGLVVLFVCASLKHFDGILKGSGGQSQPLTPNCFLELPPRGVAIAELSQGLVYALPLYAKPPFPPLAHSFLNTLSPITYSLSTPYPFVLLAYTF